MSENLDDDAAVKSHPDFSHIIVLATFLLVIQAGDSLLRPAIRLCPRNSTASTVVQSFILFEAEQGAVAGSLGDYHSLSGAGRTQ